jgi:hypothetical protein
MTLVRKQPTKAQVTAGAKALVEWNWGDHGKTWRELVETGDTANFEEQATVVLKAALKVKS